MSFGGAVKLTGESEYRKALSQITQSLREVSSEMSVVTSAYGKNDNSLGALEAKQKALNQALEKQKTVLSNATNAYTSFKSKVDEQANAHNALVQKYENEKKKLEEIKKSQGETSSAYQNQLKVVSSLQDEVRKSTIAYDANENALSKLKTQLNNAQTAVNKTTGEIDKLGKETEETGKQAENAGEGFTVFKGVISNLASSAIQAAISGVKRLGSAVVNVGKQSLSAYASYEQLVGGVETLFKDSADVVQEYAANAYKTAGISANEYMEQVTSFSATLLQGLNGDTKKAADVADVAIRDMADNANKMGTSMYMIQNAYQGFAKDNYTMLDNLKLGYGGTQAEMARLINDSGVLGDAIEVTAKTVKDVPFDKIIEAIHKTQQEIGITGTTTLEAEKTIEGSSKSMAAAWQNLLVAIADDNADLAKSVSTLVDNVVAYGKNSIPRIKQIVNGFKELVNNVINEVFPKLKRQIPELKPLIETFEWFIHNKGLVVGAVQAMLAAFAVAKVMSFTKSMSDAAKGVLNFVKMTLLSTAATKADTVAQGADTAAKVAGTAATGGLTVATHALNAAWKANPIGLVVAGLTALISVIALVKSKTNQLTEAEKAQQEASEETSRQIQERITQWEDLVEAQQNAINAGMTEISHYETLYGELQGIVDQNGKVKKGYEERASFITSQLSEALGIEIRTVDGVIQKYGDLKKTIDEVMEKKKAQIILDSQETLYKDAINNQTAALQALNDKSAEVATKKQEYAALDAKLKDEQAARDEAYSGVERAYHDARILQIEKQMEKRKEELDAAQSDYDARELLVQEYAYNIGLYEQNMAAAHAGEYEKMSTVTWDYVKDYEKAGDAELAALQDKVAQTETHLSILKELQEKSGSDIYDSQIKAAEKQLTEAKKQMGKYRSTTLEGLLNVKGEWSDQLDAMLSTITGKNIKFEEAGDGNIQMYIDGVATGEKTSKEEMAKIVSDMVAEVKKEDFEDAGKNAISGVTKGVNNQDKQNGAFTAIASFGSKLLGKLRAALKEKSPSKATAEMGSYLLEGLGIGIKKKENPLLRQVSGVGRSVLNAFNAEMGQGVTMRSITMPDVPSVSAVSRARTATAEAQAQAGYAPMVGAFKEALGQMKIVLDDEVAGHFVEQTVTRVIYS